MPDTETQHFALVKPEIGGSDNTWGQKLHDNYDKIDSILAKQKRNYIINGTFDVWQRGTSFTSSGYSADRWVVNKTPNITLTFSRRPWAVGDRRSDGQFYASIDVSATGSTDAANIQQKIESHALPNRTVTLSFRARASAGQTRYVGVRLRTVGTANEIDYVLLGPILIDDSFERYTVTGTFPVVPSGATFLFCDVIIDFCSPLWSETTQQSGLIDVSGVQLELGDVATPLETRHVATELELCQRYYWQGSAIGRGIGLRSSSSALTFLESSIGSFPVTMRVTPTVSIVTEPTYENCTHHSVVSSESGFAHRVDTTGATGYRTFGGVYAADAEL